MDIKRRLAAAGVVAIAFGGAAAGATGSDERPRIDVHITNHADVRPDALARARTEVERIFEHADVRVAWVDDDEPGRISILLLSLTQDSQEHAAGCALGLALVPQATAYVFVSRIVRTTRHRAVDLPVVLGRVIAHEIGHILMPRRRHSRFGIMRADLDVGYANPARFSDEEAQVLQSRLGAVSDQ